MRPLVLIMGVSGAGKSTVGGLLAERLRVTFADAALLIGHIAARASSCELSLDMGRRF